MSGWGLIFSLSLAARTVRISGQALPMGKSQPELCSGFSAGSLRLSEPQLPLCPVEMMTPVTGSVGESVLPSQSVFCPLL
jgi:hypothetical protein